MLKQVQIQEPPEPRVPDWYLAPSNIHSDAEAVCKLCGEKILPGQLIGEWNEEYVHEDCVQEQIDDSLGDCT
jgi:hypothetical protein